MSRKKEEEEDYLSIEHFTLEDAMDAQTNLRVTGLAIRVFSMLRSGAIEKGSISSEDLIPKFSLEDRDDCGDFLLVCAAVYGIVRAKEYWRETEDGPPTVNHLALIEAVRYSSLFTGDIKLDDMNYASAIQTLLESTPPGKRDLLTRITSITLTYMGLEEKSSDFRVAPVINLGDSLDDISDDTNPPETIH